MKLALAAAASVGVAVEAGVAAAPVSQVQACTISEDFNPVAVSDLIVAGRITGWEIAPTIAPPDPMPTPFLTIRVHLTVDRVFKGSAGPQVTFLETRSLREEEDLSMAQRWQGTGGACGSFGSDPTGNYLLIGLRLEDDGNYYSSGPTTFNVGGPSTPEYLHSIETLRVRYGLQAPATGDGGLINAGGPP
jgi:hypothetical protein